MHESARFVGRGLSRRGFIRTAALAASAGVAGTRGAFSGLAEDNPVLPIAVFTKVYQTLNLNFEDSAAVTAEAGLAGIDCPLRPGGEVLPERVAEDLPRYAEALRKNNLRLPLLTTAITSPTSPHAETILRTAKKLGVQFYRLGFIEREKGVAAEKQVREVRAQLKDLAGLNKTIGLGALVQNHSPSGHAYLGGNLGELRDIVADFDAAQIGVAFDIGHALIVHGDDWRKYFEQLKSHLKVAYVKDAKREGGWVRFGQGDVVSSGYFSQLRELHFQGPISMHIEFDWTDQGQQKNRAALVSALQNSSKVLKWWLAQG